MATCSQVNGTNPTQKLLAAYNWRNRLRGMDLMFHNFDRLRKATKSVVTVNWKPFKQHDSGWICRHIESNLFVYQCTTAEIPREQIQHHSSSSVQHTYAWLKAAIYIYHTLYWSSVKRTETTKTKQVTNQKYRLIMNTILSNPVSKWTSKSGFVD